ncbi:MAG: hypothetical protein JSW51_00655 [Gemmatimonadota bacterium]|nr:MAG: hypothetical protein JSW51_00655 [Gemmatimonadota bacterium]
MQSIRPLTLTVVTYVAFAGSSCSDAETPCDYCTLEFRTYTLDVVDDASQPVSDVMITRVNRRTGDTLTPGWLGMLQPGTYLVADDGMLDSFSIDGDTVQVTGVKDDLTFVQNFVFATDICHCHVTKVAGPQTVIIGEAPPH